MTRLTTRLVLTGALLLPAAQAFALGLGEIHLNSALNQPFDADIELISPAPDEVAALKVAIANNDLFARYGLERAGYLSGFTFTVNQTRDGRAFVHVASNQSITEPFVTLLVEASWPRGRLLREYTVLLDPPVFSADKQQQEVAKAPAVEAPQSGARNEGRIERTPAPAPERAAPSPVPAPSTPSSQAESTPAAANAGGEYRVKHNDTLFAIAKEIRPGSRKVVNQTMIALFRANPEAFQGNINRLRANATLRIPENADIEAVGTREAGAEVAQQYEAWRGATLAGGGDSARLRLVTPKEQPAEPAAASTPATKKPGAGQSPSGAAAAGTEKAADKNRLDVKSPELAALQQGNQAKKPAETPAQPEAAPAPAVETPKAEQPAAEPAPAAAEPTPQPAAQTPPATTPTAAAKKPAPPAEEGPSLLDRLGEMWWILVAGGLLIILGLLFVLLKKRRASSAAAEQSFDVSGFTFEPRTRSSPQVSVDLDQEEEMEEEPTSTLSRREESHSFEEEPEEEAPRTVVRTAPPASSPRPSEDTLSSETAVRLDQQDALAEADFHMAYGLYDQAADLVKIAIAREPARRDLKLKLLEIYFVWGNRDLFLETARELHDTSSQAPAGEWEKVVIMGKQIAPDDSLFKGDAGGSRGLDMVDVNLEGGENRVDVDLFAEPEPEKPAGLDLEFSSGERKGPESSGESNLDFLLDEPKRGDDGESTREYDSLSRTQETPTIESPMLDEEATNIEKLDVPGFGKAAASSDQTAELSLDDLGLDVDALESTGSLEETGAIDRTKRRGGDAPLRDDEKTQLAPSLGSLEKTMQGPKFEKFDDEGTGTIYVADVDLSGSGDTVEQRGPDGKPVTLDVDLDDIDAQGGTGDTLRQRRIDPDADRFSSDVFANERSAPSKIDLDVGEPLADEDRSPTNTQAVEMELSELEPVTMSEVGTKLDLARAYMDMGDPDGARSILDEVLQEGNPGQKQEAQRLLESIR